MPAKPSIKTSTTPASTIARTEQGCFEQLPLPAWPEWVENKRVKDTLIGEAYEQAGSGARAAIKTAIALFSRYDGTTRDIVHDERSDAASGFWRARTIFPAPWAIIAFPKEYTAAARLLGAIMPAILSGVPLIAAVCVDGTPDKALLAALDLAGIGDVFSLTEAELAMLMEETQPGPGRVVFLHTGSLDALRRQARSLHIPVFEERRTPSLTIPRPELFNLDILKFAQGKEAVDRAIESPSPEMPDALYAALEAVRAHSLGSVCGRFSLGMAPLALAPGCEGFWLHHGLGRSFFLAHRVGFGIDMAEDGLR